MARGCSVCTLYTLNFVLFLLGAIVLAAPLLSCTEVCHITMTEIESLRFVRVLQIIGGCLVVFSLFGCGLAASGKKRYRGPYLLVLLLAVLGGGLLVALDQGLLFEKLATYDPSAPHKVQKAIDGLATSGMESFYHDFAGVFDAAKCKVEAAAPHESHVTCHDCEPVETAFSKCMEDWVQSTEADHYLQKCSAKFAGQEAACGGECTLAFCQCAGVLGETVEHYARFAKYGLLGVGSLLLLLLVASVCVSRKEAAPLGPQTQQMGQVFIVEGSAGAPRRQQPVLA